MFRLTLNIVQMCSGELMFASFWMLAKLLALENNNYNLKLVEGDICGRLLILHFLLDTCNILNIWNKIKQLHILWKVKFHST